MQRVVVLLRDKITHHLGKCCKQARALFSKEHNPRAPRFQCWGRGRGVAANGQNGCTTPDQDFLIPNIEIGGCGGLPPLADTTDASSASSRGPLEMVHRFVHETYELFP